MTGAAPNSLRVAVVSAVNREDILQANLARSPAIVSGEIPLHKQVRRESASIAYNAALDGVVADVILFVHQDVYLPAPSISRILAGIRKIEKKDSNWGLIGIIGLDRSNGLVGEVWDPRGRIGVLTGGYSEVVAMDELVLVMRTAAGLRFDPRLPAFHLYAADMIQIAATRGMKSYVVDCPVVHNSPVHGYLGPTWAESYRYMQTKWWERLPIATLIMPVTKTGLPLLRYWLRVTKRKMLRRELTSNLEINSAAVSSRLGYDEGTVKLAETRDRCVQ